MEVSRLLKILLMKIFSNDSDFFFTFQYMKFWTKSLYGRKFFISEKKKRTKIFEKNNFFQNRYWGGMVEELFAYIFGIYKQFGGNNPSILALFDSVSVAA